jgi:hypothetical protein
VLAIKELHDAKLDSYRTRAKSEDIGVLGPLHFIAR